MFRKRAANGISVCTSMDLGHLGEKSERPSVQSAGKPVLLVTSGSGENGRTGLETLELLFIPLTL